MKSTVRKILIGITVFVFIIILGLVTVRGQRKGKMIVSDDRYREYVQAALASVYQGDYDKYIKKYKGLDDMMELHDSMVTYFMELVFYKYSIDTSLADERILGELRAILDEMLRRTEITIGETWLINEEYKVEVTIGKLNFWPLAAVTCDEIYLEYMNDFNENRFEDYSMAMWEKYTAAYADDILNGIKTIQARVASYGSTTISVTVSQDRTGRLYMEWPEWYAMMDYIIGVR